MRGSYNRGGGSLCSSSDRLLGSPTELLFEVAQPQLDAWALCRERALAGPCSLGDSQAAGGAIASPLCAPHSCPTTAEGQRTHCSLGTIE